MPRAPQFPPLIAGHALSDDDPFVVAASAAASGKAGAGDLFWRDTDHQLSAAIVLEPEPGEAQAEAAHLTTMVAMGDCIGTLSPPEVGIFYRWPDKICANGAEVGTARFAAGPAAKGAAPAWLVSSVDIRIRAEKPVLEPGRTPEVTTLWDEGCGGISMVPLLESFARHLNTWLHTLETEGARPVNEAWLARAEGRGEAVTLSVGDTERSGTFLGIDENGDLILKTDSGTQLISLRDALL